MTQSTSLQEILRRFFGFDSFRPAQEEIIRSLLSGHDTLAVLPTGGGKSLCYQLAALCQSGLTIVVSPLIALMKDQVDALTAQNIPATALHSGLDSDTYRERISQLQSGHIRLLYLAPERLSVEKFMGLLRRLPIPLFIVDEAHCISEWGHDFRPSYRAIAQALSSLPQRPVIGAFTATATPAVMTDIRQYLQLQNEHTFVTGFDRPNLYFDVVRTPQKMAYLFRFLSARRDASGIIYCSTRDKVNELHAALVKKGWSAAKYHGGLTDAERTIAQEDFIHDRIHIMVATNAFGMGIDKPDVRFVVHYQIPKSIEAYYQESGRAGRDGLPAACVLLFNETDCPIQEFLIEQSGNDPAAHLRFKAMKTYARTSKCLRQNLLAHFHQQTEPCGHCRNCLYPPTYEVRTEDVRAILRTVAESPRPFGKETIIRILRGTITAKDRQYRLHTMPYYASRHDADKADLEHEVDQLISAEYLHMSSGRYPTLEVTRSGKEVIRGGISVSLAAVCDEPVSSPNIANDARTRPLFHLLRDLRTRFAREKGVPSYIIFQDDTLLEMSTKQPQTLTEMAHISGVGKYKLDVYGPSFLDIITTWRKKHE